MSGANVRYWHKADMRRVHCTCLLLTQSGHRHAKGSVLLS